MRKTCLLLSAVLMLSSASFAAAHPDTVGFSVGSLDGKISDSQMINLVQDSEENVKTEFLSVSWIFQNFILLLAGIIALAVAVVVVLTYREEISFRKACKITRQKDDFQVNDFFVPRGS